VLFVVVVLVVVVDVVVVVVVVRVGFGSKWVDRLVSVGVSVDQ